MALRVQEGRALRARNQLRGMRSSRQKYEIQRAGEYIVAGELCRHKFIATTFSGNLPAIDILALREDGATIKVQVKTIRSRSWQLDAGNYLEIEIKDGEQIVKGPRQIEENIFCVFVKLAEDEDRTKDEFYVLSLADLQRIFLEDYHGGKRPKNPESLHYALYPERLAPHKGRWEIL